MCAQCARRILRQLRPHGNKTSAVAKNRKLQHAATKTGPLLQRTVCDPSARKDPGMEPRALERTPELSSDNAPQRSRQASAEQAAAG